MWQNVIISVLSLPNQIKVGVLVSNQASFGFLTVNILFDHWYTFSYFVISVALAILQHSAFLDRNRTLPGLFYFPDRVQVLWRMLRLDHWHSTVVAVHGTFVLATVCFKRSFCVSALPLRNLGFKWCLTCSKAKRLLRFATVNIYTPTT